MVGLSLPGLTMGWGTLGGVAAGALLFGWPGAIAGLGGGAILDRRLSLLRFSPWVWRRSARSRGERAHLVALFAVAGYLAKADGRVSELEIAATRRLMDDHRLDRSERRLAVDLFTRGKTSSFPLRPVLRRFRRYSRRRPSRRNRLFDALLGIACADGPADPSQVAVLREVVTRLGLDSSAGEAAIERARRGTGQRPLGRAVKPTLSKAFAVLDVPETASADEIKQAYRRMLSRHHPDRLVGRGMPESAVKAATERTHEIRSAYEQIRRARRF